MIPVTLERIIAGYGESDRKMVLSAWDEACTALEGRLRGNNKAPFIEHPLGVAQIIAEMTGLGADAVTAVFLHEANRFQSEDAAGLNSSPMLQSFRRRYPADIISIVQSLNRISFIRLQETNLDAERYRKLLVSYSGDPRAIIIKLADRLEIIRNLDLIPPSKQQSKILEALLLYVPLAHQTGLYAIKSEMEDRYLRFADPEQYRSITNKLKATEKDREKLADTFIRPLRQKLDREGIHYVMKARTKSAYSIWKKMLKQKVPFEKIYDVFAMRFIIDCPPVRKTEHELCWKVYSLVTEEYEPDVNRLRDWLTVPKPNGYESLHTTVAIAPGNFVEVQIRTSRMDAVAEMGNASHWSYKGVQSETRLTDWLNHVREMLSSDSRMESADRSPALLGEVFVFTPTGELKQLHAGATVLDFAFSIHSNVGLKCTGGRINGRMASIREELHDGDVVEIITSRNQKPTQDWLNFVVTTKARTKIRQKLKEEENKRAAAGKEMLARRARNWKIEIRDEDLAAVAKKLRFKTLNEFFEKVGQGVVDLLELKEFFMSIEEEAGSGSGSGGSAPGGVAGGSGSGTSGFGGGPAGGSAKGSVTGGGSAGSGSVGLASGRASGVASGRAGAGGLDEEPADDYVIIGSGNLGNVEYKMARCCNPVYGDDVFGFVTVKDGLKIHRMSCPNAARLLDMYPYRIQKVRWRKDKETSRSQVSLRIVARGDISATQTVLDVIGRFKASVRSMQTTEHDEGPAAGTIEINIQLYVPSDTELDKILALLRRSRTILQVTRL